MRTPRHPDGTRGVRLPSVEFDVVTLPGARGAALWRWWLSGDQRHPVPLAARCAVAEAPLVCPPRDAEPGITVVQLDLADDRPAGIVIDL